MYNFNKIFVVPSNDFDLPPTILTGSAPNDFDRFVSSNARDAAGQKKRMPQQSAPISLLDAVCALRHKPWNWRNISGSPCIEWETIITHPSLQWDAKYLSSNENLTLDILDAYPTGYNRKGWDWDLLSANAAFTLADIEATPEKPWRRLGLSYNPNLTWDYVEPTVRGPKVSFGRDWGKWDMAGISARSIAWNNVSENLDLPWDWTALTQNQRISWDAILDNRWAPWDYSVITKHPSATLDVIRSHPFGLDDEPWTWDMYEVSKKVEWDYIKSHHDGLHSHENEFIGQWDWRGVAANPTVEMSTIEVDFPFNWDWAAVSLNPNLSYDDILRHPNRNWDWDCFERPKVHVRGC